MMPEHDLKIRKSSLLTPLRWMILLLLIVPVLTVQSAPAAPSATIFVNTTADEFGTGKNCSLREAIQAANTNSDFGGCIGVKAYGSDVITLPAGTYTLTGAAGEDNNASGDLDITSALTINGAAAKTTIIQAGTASPISPGLCVDCVDRVLHITNSPAMVQINNVTIRYGKAPDGTDGVVDFGCDGEYGGGIYLDTGTLTLNISTISYNRAGDAGDGCWINAPGNGIGGGGGGIFNKSGILIFNAGSVRYNEAGSGGDATSGRDGTAGGLGGGIYLSSSGVMTLTNTTVSSNTSGAGGRGSDMADANAGSGGDGGRGGGIYARGYLEIINSDIIANRTGPGGGAGDVTSGDGDGGEGGGGGAGAGICSIDSAASLTVVGSTIQDNETGLPARGGSGSGTGSSGANGSRGRGGGLYVIDSAECVLRDSTINANQGSFGGGIYILGAYLEMTACTISGNVGSKNGGGIIIGSAAVLEMHNNTISGNSTDIHGGGIYNYNGTVLLDHVTMTGNTADADNDGVGDGGGLMNVGVMTMTNSIIAQNYAKSNIDPDCGGWSVVTSGGYNLLGIGDSSGCTFVPQPGDLVGTTATPLDPQLGLLDDNGGSTWTHSLKITSPAVDQIPAGVNGCVVGSRDQRGVLRFPPCDMGAFEIDQSEHIYAPMVSRE